MSQSPLCSNYVETDNWHQHQALIKHFTCFLSISFFQATLTPFLISSSTQHRLLLSSLQISFFLLHDWLTPSCPFPSHLTLSVPHTTSSYVVCSLLKCMSLSLTAQPADSIPNCSRHWISNSNCIYSPLFYNIQPHWAGKAVSTPQ